MPAFKYVPPGIELTVYMRAVEWFRKQLGLKDEAMAKIQKAAGESAKNAVQWQKLRMTADILKQGRKGVEEGKSVPQIKDELKKSLEKKWSLNVKDNQLETTVRTNQQRSYSAARWEQIQETKTTHPYIKFSAIMDKSTTPVCVACNGTVLPVDDPFWVNHRPPLHFNCRSMLVAIRKTVAEKVGVTTKKPDVDPPEGFGDPTQEWSPDLRRLPRSLVKRRKK